MTCTDLCVGYDGHEVLHGINFTVPDGDYLCIVGENGAGKSTLMKTILGLLPPISGHVSIDGGIGYLPQQTIVQKDFPATVEEIVLSAFQSHFFHTPEERHIASENLAKMGITQLSKRCYRELSGGQQQRVLLARALCATKKMLLLDEPVAGLDPQVTEEMYTLIQQLNNDGITIIMISHDLQAVQMYAKHILHVSKEGVRLD